MQNAKPNLYDRDFHAWSLLMAEHLRAKNFDQIDIENVAEEIESLARSDYRELISRLEVLIAHLLKWQYQPAKRCRSWQGTMAEQRGKIDLLLSDSPSLKPRLQGATTDRKVYQHAKNRFFSDTGIDLATLPPNNPYTTAQLLDEDFYPSAALQK